MGSLWVPVGATKRKPERGKRMETGQVSTDTMQTVGNKSRREKTMFIQYNTEMEGLGPGAVRSIIS